jgi:hypothetical protein
VDGHGRFDGISVGLRGVLRRRPRIDRLMRATRLKIKVSPRSAPNGGSGLPSYPVDTQLEFALESRVAEPTIPN